MKRKKESWLQFLLFLSLLIVAIFIANNVLIKMDAASFFTLREMQQSSDIELALVGSSVVRNQFDPLLISEITGKKAFNVGLPCLALPGSIAATSMLYDTNSPEWTVLVVEHDTFCVPAELPDAQDRLMPMLTGPLRRLRYYLDLCAQDGNAFDRLFPFKHLHVSSMKELKKSLSLRFDPDGYLAKHPGLVSGTDVYKGRGFVRMELREDMGAFLRHKQPRPGSFYSYNEMTENAQQLMRRYKALCEQKGSRLLVIFSPNLTARSLADADFMHMKDSVARFMREEGIDFYDFSLAKPALMPCLDPYYLDYFHINADGTQILSRAFAEFLNRFAAGEDVSSLFYASQEEYRQSIGFITNVYGDVCREGEETVVSVDCNRGTSVEPEYSFALLGEDGAQTLLRNYAPENTLRVPSSIVDGQCMRVYARPKNGAQEDAVYCDL